MISTLSFKIFPSQKTYQNLTTQKAKAFKLITFQKTHQNLTTQKIRAKSSKKPIIIENSKLVSKFIKKKSKSKLTTHFKIRKIHQKIAVNKVQNTKALGYIHFVSKNQIITLSKKDNDYHRNNWVSLDIKVHLVKENRLGNDPVALNTTNLTLYMSSDLKKQLESGVTVIQERISDKFTFYCDNSEAISSKNLYSNCLLVACIRGSELWGVGAVHVEWHFDGNVQNSGPEFEIQNSFPEIQVKNRHSGSERHRKFKASRIRNLEIENRTQNHKMNMSDFSYKTLKLKIANFLKYVLYKQFKSGVSMLRKRWWNSIRSNSNSISKEGSSKQRGKNLNELTKNQIKLKKFGKKLPVNINKIDLRGKNSSKFTNQSKLANLATFGDKPIKTTLSMVNNGMVYTG